MAFPVEGSWSSVGVCVRHVNSAVAGQVFGGSEDVDTVRKQTARILSLDLDGRGYPHVGGRDPIAAKLQARYAGLRPVCFNSTYEVAVWAILSQRTQMRQAARVKERLREAFGELVDIHGLPMRAFPSPRMLLSVGEAPGIPTAKLAWLHVVAQAALAGDLDAAHLRSLPDEEALARLREVPGIGPFSAELILLRGAGHPDYLTLLEACFRRAVEQPYGFDHLPTDRELRRISESWRPYRTWVTFLLRQGAGRNYSGSSSA